MHKAAEWTAPILFVIGAYIALPVGMISGWVRWAKRAQPRTLSSILSLVGFTLATASGLLAISTMMYTRAIGGFRYYDPLLLRIYGWGGLLSIAGIVSAISGAWR